MVSSKTLRQVELVCRLTKNSQIYFGGIQIILCGDFYQLPPIRDELYDDYGHYCFETEFFNKLFPHTITLTNVHRQTSDENSLIAAVNEVEKGCVREDTVKFLGNLSRPLQSDTCIKLFARNLDVDIYNYEQLHLLDEPLRTFTAKDEGDPFYLNKMLAPKNLGVKVTAPVMLLINISDELVNGLMGTVLSMEDDTISVEFKIHDTYKS
jgi:ATP-dependent DNA helicase PIF1